MIFLFYSVRNNATVLYTCVIVIILYTSSYPTVECNSRRWIRNGIVVVYIITIILYIRRHTYLYSYIITYMYFLRVYVGEQHFTVFGYLLFSYFFFFYLFVRTPAARRIKKPQLTTGGRPQFIYLFSKLHSPAIVFFLFLLCPRDRISNTKAQCKIIIRALQ